MFKVRHEFAARAMTLNPQRRHRGGHNEEIVGLFQDFPYRNCGFLALPR
jgi:hypothetical protein